MTTPISFLSLRQSIESVSTKMISNVSLSNVTYLDANAAVSNATTAVSESKVRLNGANFTPGGSYVYFDHEGEVLSKSGIGKYVSNTELRIESLPDLGDQDITVTPIILTNGGFAVANSTMSYTGSFKFEPQEYVYGWKGTETSYLYASSVSGSSGNLTFTLVSSDVGNANVTLSSSGVLTANVGTVSDESSRYSMTVRVTDTDKNISKTATNELRLLGRPTQIVTNLMGDDTATHADLLLDYEGAKTTLVIENYARHDYTDASSYGLGYNVYTQYGGSLKGKRIISAATGFYRGYVDAAQGTGANFFITDDGHVHGVGSQRGMTKPAGTFDAYAGSLGLGRDKYSHQYEANVQYESSLLLPVDFTETYGWPACKKVVCGVQGRGFAYLTTDGALYVWGHGNEQATVTPLIPWTSYDVTDGSTARILLTPKLSAGFPKDPAVDVGSTSGGARWVAWTPTGVWQFGQYTWPTIVNSNGTAYTGNTASACIRSWTQMTHGGWTSGYTSSLSGRTIKSVAAVNFGGSQVTWALCTDGTLHVWNTTYNGATDNGTADTDKLLNGMTRQRPWALCTNGTFSGKFFTKLVTTGYGAFAALDSLGNIHNWGYNEQGELARNGAAAASYNSPAIINSYGSLAGKTIVDIWMARYHFVALDSTGRLHFAGYIDTTTYFPALKNLISPGGTNLLTPTLIPTFT